MLQNAFDMPLTYCLFDEMCLNAFYPKTLGHACISKLEKLYKVVIYFLYGIFFNLRDIFNHLK